MNGNKNALAAGCEQYRTKITKFKKKKLNSREFKTVGGMVLTHFRCIFSVY
jgi:hypothetical protein